MRKHPKIIIKPKCSNERGLKGYTQAGEVHICLNGHDNEQDVILTIEHEILHFCFIDLYDTWIPVVKQHRAIRALMSR